MRILVITNFYPPYHITGYELGCQDIVRSLKTRGHQVRVLTSRYCFKEELVEGDVYRWLKPSFKEILDWRTAVLKELVNQTAFKRVCRDFQPEVVFFFNLTHISASLGLLAREMGLPTCSYLSNNWFAILEKDHWFRVWPKEKKGFKILRFSSRRYKLQPPSQPLQFGHAIFTNGYLKDLAIQLKKPMSQAAVIPWGIDIGRFSSKKAPDQKPSRLLYVGQIRPHKCVDTAIKTLGTLKRDYGYDALSLTIAGNDPADPTDPSSSKSPYLTSLRDLAKKYGLEKQVRFQGWTAREAMPAVYQAHDILIFPSGDQGASSLTLLEAMSCGLGIVSTSTRGNSEILKDENNALVFPKEDSSLCAQQVLRLLRDLPLYESIRTNARKTIEQGFRIEKSVDSIEGVLEEATRQAGPDHHQIAADKNSLLEDGHPEKSLSELARQAKNRLRLGALAVSIRTMAKPQFFIRKGKKAIYVAVSLTALLILPVFFEAFFWLAGRRRKSSQTDIGQIKRVLVIQLADIGDVLLSSPFLRELRRLLPNAWIGLVVQPAMFNMVEKCPYVDDVIPFRWRSFKNWGDAFSGHILWWLQTTGITVRSLWKHQIDMAISLRWNNDAPQAAALTLMYTGGAPQRVGFLDVPHDRIPYRSTDINRLITRGPVRTFLKHEIDLQMEILSSLGASPTDTRLEVWTGEEDDDFAGNALSRSGISENDLLIAFAPGAAWPYRRWPAERFIALGRWLQESQKAYIVILSAKDERGLARRIERGLQRGRTVNLAAKTTIRQMAAVLKHCRLFVGNDSGPMHVAAGVGVPVVGFFGPGEYERFRPWGSNHEVIRLGLPCSPCSQNCVFDDPRCIKGISLEQTKEVVFKKLENVSRK